MSDVAFLLSDHQRLVRKLQIVEAWGKARPPRLLSEILEDEELSSDVIP